jgi:hypothetical protein
LLLLQSQHHQQHLVFEGQEDCCTLTSLACIDKLPLEIKYPCTVCVIKYPRLLSIYDEYFHVQWPQLSQKQTKNLNNLITAGNSDFKSLNLVSLDNISDIKSTYLATHISSVSSSTNPVTFDCSWRYSRLFTWINFSFCMNVIFPYHRHWFQFQKTSK